jgi:hypothetical protein
MSDSKTAAVSSQPGYRWAEQAVRDNLVADVRAAIERQLADLPSEEVAAALARFDAQVEHARSVA